MGLFRKSLYIIMYKTKGAGRMLDHNISLWFVAHEFNANNLYCHWVYTATHLTISRIIIITIFQNYFGDSRRVERLCSGCFPAHSEWASSIPIYHSYAHAQEWIDDLQIRKRTFLKQSFNSMLTHIQFKTHFVWITNLKVQQPNISHIYTLYLSCGTFTGSAPNLSRAQERISWACRLLLR